MKNRIVSTHMYAYVLLLGRFVPMAVDLRLFNFRNSLRSRVKFKMMRFLGKRISQLMSKRINFTMHSVDESKSHLIRFARQKTFGPAMGKKCTWKINKSSLRIVGVLFAFDAMARHSCELQPPAEPMPRRRTLLSGRRCQPSRQTSTRVGHMLFHFCLLGKGAEINALPGRKILMNLFTHLWSPCPPIDSSKICFHHLCV